jgi:hypothetical protein
MSDMNKNQNPNEIAVIGYSQAGKTTLAVGLFATSTADFAVTAKGEEATNYLTDRKAMLEAGEWIEASIASTDIRLAIERIGKPTATIDFKEYRGEDAFNFDAFLRDVIGDPRGALILLNPKMEILRDADRRNTMITQIKGIIDYLSDPKKRCSHVAFVITASDLLATSLKGYKEEFDGYKAEITNYLNMKFRKTWKEFDVTVTGPLEDPSRPRIARMGNTSREPFVWLIDQIEKSSQKVWWQKTARRVLFGALTLVGLGLAAFASWYFGFDRTAERKIKEILTANAPLLDQAVKDGKDTSINKCCEKMEGALASVTTNKSFFAKPYFRANKESYRKVLELLARKIEDGRLSYYPARMTSLKNELENFNPQDGIGFEAFESRHEKAISFGAKLSAFSVKNVDNQNALSGVRQKWEVVKKTILEKLESGCCIGFRKLLDEKRAEVENRLLNHEKMIDGDFFEDWEETMFDGAYRVSKLMMDASSLNAIVEEARKAQTDLPVRVDQHNGAVLERRVRQYAEKAETEATEENCKEWRRVFEEWNPSTADGRHRRNEMLENFDKEKDAWRSQYESKKFSDGVQSLLTTLADLKLSPDEATAINDALAKCRDYERIAEEGVTSLVNYGVRTNGWTQIEGARSELLSSLLESQIKRVSSDNPNPPTITDDDMVFLEAAIEVHEVLPPELLGDWTNRLNAAVVAKYGEWEMKQNNACDGFVKKISGRKGLKNVFATVKNEYPMFCSDHPYAPKLEEVARSVNDVVLPAFREIYNETVGYLEDNGAILDSHMMKAREEKMQATFSGLKDLVNATVKAGDNKNCKSFRASTAYRFAKGCQDKGVRFDGVKTAFKQNYTITQIDAMAVDNSWSKYSQVAFEAAWVKFDALTNAFTNQSIGRCKTLIKDDNKEWRTIWKGSSNWEGTPWSDAVFAVLATEGKWFPDSKGLRWSFKRGENYGSEIKLENGYNEQSWKVSDDVTVYVRIYVQGSGIDFLSFAKPYLFGDN